MAYSGVEFEVNRKEQAMRVKTVRQQYLNFELPSSGIKEVRRYRQKYERLNTLLVDVPELLDLAHADFDRWLSTSKQGRESRFTSEELLRVIIVILINK
jgi:hypothetical protein